MYIRDGKNLDIVSFEKWSVCELIDRKSQYTETNFTKTGNL